jgi:hypothetical protein
MASILRSRVCRSPAPPLKASIAWGGLSRVYDGEAISPSLPLCLHLVTTA